MTLLGRLALLFVLVPIAELVVLIEVGRRVGVWTTVALVFFTGIAGAVLARAEGLRTLWAFRRDVSRGRIPGRAILDGVSILVGGALLLTPGFLTDVVGFSLLLPPTRRLLQRWARRRIRGMIDEGTIRVVGSWGPVSTPDEPHPGEGGPSGPPGGEDDDDLDPDKEIIA